MVVATIADIFQDPLRLLDALGSLNVRPTSLNRIQEHAKAVSTELLKSNDANRRGLLQGIIRRVDISTRSMAITLGRNDLARVLKIKLTSIDSDSGGYIAFSVPIKLQRRGIEARLVIGGADVSQRQPDRQLCFLIAKAHLWFEEIASIDAMTVRAIAERDNVHETEVSRALPLAFLAPDIVVAILDGRQPVEMTVKALRRIANLPSDWDMQRRLLGFSD